MDLINIVQVYKSKHVSSAGSREEAIKASERRVECAIGSEVKQPLVKGSVPTKDLDSSFDIN